MVDPEPLDFSSDSGDEVLNIIVSPGSDDEEFAKFEPVTEVELVLDIVVS
jgi:hypothetical protein